MKTVPRMRRALDYDTAHSRESVATSLHPDAIHSGRSRNAAISTDFV